MNMLKSKTAEVETAYMEAKETLNEMEKLIRQVESGYHQKASELGRLMRPRGVHKMVEAEDVKNWTKHLIGLLKDGL